MKLWVDDLRPAPEGWVWVKTATDAIFMLTFNLDLAEEVESSVSFRAVNGITEISLDHDLGGDDTTMPVVDWMAEHDRWPAVVRVHTQNPVGRENLTRTINRYGPGVTR